MATYIEASDEGYFLQLNKFCERIDTYSATLGLDPVKVQQIKDDKEYFGKVYAGMILTRDFAESFTNYKNLLRYGHGDEVLGSFPTPPTITPPAVVFTGGANCQKRFAEIIQDCVISRGYTVAIGEDLGIEAPESPFVPGDGKPVIKTRYSTGGMPGFSWKKGKYQGIEIWKQAGATWTYHDKDFNPDFVDKTSTLPPAGQSSVVRYKAIYLHKGEQVGQWSDELAITVYGAV